MSNPSAFVLLDAPSGLYPSRIVEALIARHQGLRVANHAGDDGRGVQPAILHVDGVMVVVMHVAAPLPDGWQSVAQRSTMHWPEAEAVLGRHREHFRISPMGDEGSRLHAARVITAVIGALIVTHEACSGVLWDLTVANSSRVAEEIARSSFAPFPDMPSSLWVSLHPSRDSDSRIVVLTMGLQNFIGREIELDAPPAQLKSALITAHGLVAYLVQDGVNVRDGDTLGASQDERIPVRLRQSRRFQGLPVLAASLSA